MLYLGFSRNKAAEQSDISASWQGKLGTFWVFSLSQAYALWLMMSPLVSYLIGRGLGWEEFKKRQLFQMPKIGREEDAKVLIFTPSVNRETVIWAKFAAVFTYFMVINFFLTLIVFAYFLFFTNLGVMAAFLFLLLNGVGFALVNFLLIVPFLFYSQEAGSFLLYLLLSFFIFFLFFAGFFLRKFILQYPIIFIMLSVPFSVLVGYLFFSLYWQRFLTIDLD